MKTLFAVGLALVSAGFVAAQNHGLAHPLGVLPPGQTAGALGGSYLSPGMSRPLGGVSLPPLGRSTGSRKKSAQSNVGGYFGPFFYIPAAFDSFPDFSSWNPPPAANSPDTVQTSGPQQPIVINQYFVTNGADLRGPAEQAAAQPEADLPGPGDLLAPAATYYLIAYKDHSIYSALTYWLEGNTLHYVTTQNTHNQASLELIDVERTWKLNSDRSVPFSIPGK